MAGSAYLRDFVTGEVSNILEQAKVSDPDGGTTIQGPRPVPDGGNGSTEFRITRGTETIVVMITPFDSGIVTQFPNPSLTVDYPLRHDRG